MLFNESLVPEVLEVQVIPLVEVCILPESPTATYDGNLVVNPFFVSYRLLKVFPEMELTPVLTLIL